MVTEKIVNAAAMLARAAPEQWGQFVAALEDLNLVAIKALISSDLAMLQVNQGRAQAYNTMVGTFNTAIQKQEEIERRQQNA